MAKKKRPIKKLRKPKKYAASKKVGNKAVSNQIKKRQMLKDATKPPKKKKKK